MAEIRKLVAGGNMKKAIELCERGKQKALPFVVLRGLKRADESETLDFRAIQNAVDEGTLEVIPKLKERTNYLSMLANVATLTGLMGTIYGLILSFTAVGSQGVSEADKSRLLASGIAAAMNTTIFGLMVAIPSLMIYTYISNRTSKIIDELDEHLVKLINLVTGNR
jgi:biopolymer transport protein ExbB/TolQ